MSKLGEVLLQAAKTPANWLAYGSDRDRLTLKGTNCVVYTGSFLFGAFINEGPSDNMNWWERQILRHRLHKVRRALDIETADKVAAHILAQILIASTKA